MYRYLYIYKLCVYKNRRKLLTYYAGDNVLTAISVSRECGLVDQSAEVYIPRFLKGSSTEPDSELVWESVIQEGRELSVDTLQVKIYTYANQPQPFSYLKNDSPRQQTTDCIMQKILMIIVYKTII